MPVFPQNTKRGTEKMDRNSHPRKPSLQSSYTPNSATSSSRSYSKNPRNYTNTSRSSAPNSTWNNRTHNRPISSRTTVEPQRGSFEQEHVDDKVCFNDQSIVGTCHFMCPEKERSQRERLRDLATFERLHGNPGRSSSSLAVKKFCRTISTKDVQASDLRPLPVLEDTLNHLMELLDSSDQPFEAVRDFIFDRTRSIRQDLSMQSISNDQVICMYEKIVKFHVISHHKLRTCKGDSAILSSIHHLNREQLTKCLASLYNLYDVNRTSDSMFDSEAEYRSLYILLNLNSQSHSTGESLSLWFSRLPYFIIKSKEMWMARCLLRFYRMGNFWRFCSTVAADTTHLQFYIIEPYITEVWAHALECINSSGYKLQPYPLTSMAKLLFIKELDLEAFCNSCGLDVSEDDSGNKVLQTKQTGFCHPKGGFQCCGSAFLELLSREQV